MNTPGFTAEASLTRTMGKYQGNTVFSGSGAIAVLPMQGFTAAPSATQNLVWPPPWGRPVTCSAWYNGRPYCTTTWAPVWYSCQCVHGSAICRPPVLTSGGVFEER
jgi:hypothetical protein